MAEKNQPIGSVTCPIKDCNEKCDVFRYRERGAEPRSIANRRFAGKLYVRCARHGRIGGDPSDDATQDYILNNAKFSAPPIAEKAASSSATAPSSSANGNGKPVAVRHKRRRRVVSVTDDDDDAAPAESGFGFFR